MQNKKNIILIIVVALIVGGIWYFERQRPDRNTGDVENIAVTDSTVGDVTAAATTTTGATSTTSAIPKPTISAIKAILAKKEKLYDKAKEITTPDGYVNSEPFKLADLVGKKVILLDFMTYSCINCERTFPYMNAWYSKYKDKGLEIVAVQTPEFEFEKKISNVEDAVKKFGIQFPVVLDNDFSTWNEYANRYWPHKYLIDIDGYIVYDHIGEGNYEETEQKIQDALKERAGRLGQKIDFGMPLTETDQTAVPEAASPETYFGAARNSYLANGTQARVGTQNLTLPKTFDLNSLYLGGSWNFVLEYAENTGPADIGYEFIAKHLYLVTESPAGVQMTVKVDGAYLTPQNAGTDVIFQDGKSIINVNESRLYDIFKTDTLGQHTIEIHIEKPGLRAYTFTFG